MIHREGITTDIKDWTMIQASSLIQNQAVIQMYVLMPIIIYILILSIVTVVFQLKKLAKF